ncbi:MAG TPA: ABC transporter permease [Chryseosolibacter sp.]|nr:ABC transporter permease [Chryseosolibacter sp.]
MFRNYVKIAFRALLRNKVHSIINVLGLSIGIASCLLIVLFVKDELTFDRFHSKADRIYRAYAKEDWGENQQFTDITTPFPLGPTLKENFQEVEGMTRINPVGTQVKVGEALYTETILVADKDFLKMFDFEAIAGARESALDDPLGVILSESIAKKYFGDEDPINKVISMQLGEQPENFNVKAVFRDAPKNSSITYSMIISDENLPKLFSEHTLTSAWFNISPETYVMIREDANADALMQKFPALFKTLLGEDYEKSRYFVGLQPLTSIHLDTSLPAGLAPVSDPKYSYILSAIALLILVVACINFVTLSIGRSLKRAKEVGIRKVVGAVRRQLIMQFVGEAVMITIISLGLGIVLATLNLPIFNDLSGKQLEFQPDGVLALVIVSLVVIIGLFAGSYPAFVLSAFKPVSILKGISKTGNSKQTLRKVLVSVQLVLSVFLISSTILMYKQLTFLQNKNLGFNREQVAVVQLIVNQQGRLSQRVPAGFEKAQQFKNELSKEKSIINVCAASHDFGNGSWTNVGYTDDRGTYRTFFVNIVDADYIPSMQMQMVSGRAFSTSNPSDNVSSIIVNEAFVKEYGWDNPIGQRIPGKDFIVHEVIGVIKDFHFASLYTRVDPLVMTMNVSIPFSGIENINMGNSPIPKLFVRIKAGQTSEGLAAVKASWDKITGGEELEFNFVDQSLAAQYRTDENLGNIVSAACMLAMLIGSLGLYGLASIAMQNRTKEISIRKVLGATERSLLVLLSKDYMALVLIALVISVPFTIYVMNQWLSSFQYRIAIGVDTFAIAGLVSLVIAMITVSYQVLLTTSRQPADTLKYE